MGGNVKHITEKRSERHNAVSRGLSSFEVERADLAKADSVVIDGDGVEQLTQYLQSVVDRLLAHWPYDSLEPPVSIYLIDDSSYNASMTRLNSLYVHLGFLLNAESEDELAAMLAHELAHGLLQHFNADDWQAIENKAMAVAAAFAISHVAGDAAGTSLGSSGKANTAIGMMFAQRQLRRLNSEILYKSWMRHHEDQADMLAVDLLYEAGYDWQALQTVLERIADASEKIQQQQEEAAQAAQPVPDSPAAAMAEMREKLAQISLANLFSTDATQDHADAAARADNITYYIDREYSDAPLPPLKQRSTYRRMVFEGPALLVIRKRYYITEAQKALDAGNPDTATDLALNALDSASDPNAEARLVLYRAHTAAGRHDMALRNLEIARQDTSAPFMIYDLLVNEHMSLRQYDTAVERWSEARQRLNLSHREFLPRLIDLHRQAGDKTQLKTAMTRCLAFEKSDPRLTSACRAAAQPAPDRTPGSPGTEESDLPGLVHAAPRHGRPIPRHA